MNGRIIKGNLDRDFFAMRNHAMKHKGLSFKAKGILAFMIQCPPDWDFTISGLSACAKDGPDSVKAGLSELKQFKYLYYVTLSKAGRIIENQYHVSDVPFGEDYLLETFKGYKVVTTNKVGNIHVTVSGSGFSVSGKTASGKSRQLSINSIKHDSNTPIGKIEELKLPEEEKNILIAIEKAKMYFIEWGMMEVSMKENARIPPDHPTFSFNNELEKWIRHHSDKIVYLQDPGKYIPKSFSSWLRNFIKYNKDEQGTSNKKSGPSAIIDENEFNSAASSLFNKGY